MYSVWSVASTLIQPLPVLLPPAPLLFSFAIQRSNLNFLENGLLQSEICGGAVAIASIMTRKSEMHSQKRLRVDG